MLLQERREEAVVTTAWTGIARLWAGFALPLALAAQMGPVPTPVRDARRLDITVELRTGDAWVVVDPSTVFDSGAEIRFRARANFPSRLMVSYLGSSGTAAVLFPGANEANLLEPDSEILLPGSGGAFRISGPAGYDTLYWIAAPQSRAGLEGPSYTPLPPPPAPGTLLHTLVPRCDDGILRARGSCLDLRSGARQVQPRTVMTDNEVKPADLRARDLEIVRRPTPALAKPAPAAQAVIYELRIAHR